MSKVYFDNEVHDELIGKASHLMILVADNPIAQKLARDIHQTLLAEYRQDELDEDEYAVPLHINPLEDK